MPKLARQARTRPPALDDLGVGDTVTVKNLLAYMSCCHPVQSFRSGLKTANGKEDLIRCPDLAYPGCLPIASLRHPFDLATAHVGEVPGIGLCLVDPVEQPCGNCVGCRMDKAREWKIRCSLELQDNPVCYFVTLTYDDRHLPMDKSSGEPCLCRKDIQKFLKRLRKVVPNVRYYGCGEYGKQSNTARPHWHILLWAPLSLSEMVGVRKWLSSEISRTWRFGHHVVEHVTPGNIAYVCGYVEKKQADPDWFDYPVKPFTFMSTKPAIGSRYLIEHYDSIKRFKHVYGVFDDSGKGSLAPLPRYFKRKLEDLEWMKKWKEEISKESASRIETESVVYKSPNRARLGNLKEAGYYARLERFRKKTL